MFVHRDVFHVAFSPSVAAIRQLTLDVQLNKHDPKQAARLLAPLLKLKTHALFRLSITLSIPEEDEGELIVYTFAVTLEALQPLVAELEGRKEAQVVVVLAHPLFDGMDAKDMVEPAEEKRWTRSMDTALMAAYDDVSPCASVTRYLVAYEKRDFVAKRAARTTSLADEDRGSGIVLPSETHDDSKFCS